MNDFNVNNDKEILMAVMAAKGISAEEYANFLNGGNLQKTLDYLNGGMEDEHEFDYLPMLDADEKTLKIKIQLRDVTKPPMWREVLVPADFTFSQLHYIIQAVTGLDNCHLWQFGRKPYDPGLTIGIKRTDPFSFGLEDCTFDADQTPLTAFLVNKGDKLVYIYDFRLDWIFNISVSDVIERHGEVAECRKYKSELQAFDGYPPYLYTALRAFQENPQQLNKSDISDFMQMFGFEDRDMLEAFADERLFDIEFVNEELCEIPDEWEDID